MEQSPKALTITAGTGGCRCISKLQIFGLDLGHSGDRCKDFRCVQWKTTFAETASTAGDQSGHRKIIEPICSHINIFTHYNGGS